MVQAETLTVLYKLIFLIRDNLWFPLLLKLWDQFRHTITYQWLLPKKKQKPLPLQTRVDDVRKNKEEKELEQRFPCVQLQNSVWRCSVMRVRKPVAVFFQGEWRKERTEGQTRCDAILKWRGPDPDQSCSVAGWGALVPTTSIPSQESK